MPSKNKATYGPTVKKRAKRLLEALLAYVNWELEDVDGISLSHSWQDETTEQPKLVIKTQLRTLEFLTAKDKHEGQLTKTQISQALKEHLEDFLEILDDHRIEKQGKEEWHFTLKLWSRDKEKNLEQFEIEWERKRPEKSKQQEEILRETVVVDMPLPEDKSPDWRGICGQMLAEQKQLTTNAFTNADGVSLQREEIYVPLAIVERKPPKPQPRNPQEEKEEEKLIPIAEECFFEEVLRLGQSSSLGRRIAVIGEPGSGKTTRLQKIADWILEQGLGLPIWVSLADLTQPTIAQYIEEFWLKQTGQSLTIEALTQQKDQIWLLLDGVDEMTSRVETRHVSALLGGWLQSVRMVVSCRVNVWEADKNAFSGFDVFRNLEFSPEQVRDYIRCWFAGAGDVATGEDLDRALTQSENYRLKELIQNPLRLWMLCHIQYQNRDKNRGGLPETQAELYGQFVDRVYDWKADEEILDQREAIDAALARLALAAMEQQDEVSRFQLRESWVVKTLGSRQIFEAVKRLGWLNRVERSPEAICVFYHATFQEYFAALGVEDWDYFLPRDHESSPVAGKEYRIFEPQWKHVILLWIDCGIVDIEQKNSFLENLLNFEDGCGNFYKIRASYIPNSLLAHQLKDNDFKKVSSDWNLLSEDEQYVLNLPYHLAMAEMREDLYKIVTDIDFISLYSFSPAYRLNQGLIWLDDLACIFSKGTLSYPDICFIQIAIENKFSSFTKYLIYRIYRKNKSLNNRLSDVSESTIRLQLIHNPNILCWLIAMLKDFLVYGDKQTKNVNIFTFDNASYIVINHCAQSLPYPDFYHAWHSTPE